MKVRWNSFFHLIKSIECGTFLREIAKIKTDLTHFSTSAAFWSICPIINYWPLSLESNESYKQQITSFWQFETVVEITQSILIALLRDEPVLCILTRFWVLCAVEWRLLFGDFLGLIFGNLIFLRTKKTFWTKIFGLAVGS